MNKNTIFIDIELNNYCNYSCSYCHPDSYAGKNSLKIKPLMQFISDIGKGKRIDVLVSGGEPTLHPQIEDLLKYLRQQKCFVILHTNGHKPIDWWKENIEYIDSLIISYQPEFANLSKFEQKIKELAKLIHVKIKISMMIEKFDDCVRVYNTLSKIKNTTNVMVALKNKKINRLFDYNKKQLEQMKNTNPIHDIIIDKKNTYKGWNCWKGIDLIKIVSNGDCYLATCDMKVKKIYGNIYKQNLKIPSKPSVCEHDYCFCLSDLINIRRVNPNEKN